MPGATQHGMQRVPQTALEPVPAQTTVIFHMPDGRLDGASPVDRLFDRRCDATFLAAAPNGHACDIDTAIAFVDEDGFGQVISQDPPASE